MAQDFNVNQDPGMSENELIMIRDHTFHIRSAKLERQSKEFAMSGLGVHSGGLALMTEYRYEQYETRMKQWRQVLQSDAPSRGHLDPRYSPTITVFIAWDSHSNYESLREQYKLRGMMEYSG